MTTTTQIDVRVGDTLRASVTFRDPDTKVSLDMTGRKVEIVVKKASYPVQPVLINHGIFQIAVPPEATATWRAGEMRAYLRVTEPDGTVNSTADFIVNVEAG